MLERERKIAIRLLITGSGVRVPHNPLDQISGPINVGRSLDFKTIRNEFPF
jgi:hypothetical protein